MSQTTDNHAYYLTQIHQLKQLQKIDDMIHDVEQTLIHRPQELKNLQDQFTRSEIQRNRIIEKIDHLNEQSNRLKREIDEETSRLKKSKNKLMATGNEREYSAVSREIDNLEKKTQPREDERIALLEELRIQNENLAEVDVQYNELKAKLEERQASIAQELAECEKRKAELEGVREECRKDVPVPIFQRYEFIRSRLEHPVIVPLTDYICPSCHIAVPPQTFNDLLRGEHILSCPNCQRLIVWREHYMADDPNAKDAAAEGEGEAAAEGAKPAQFFVND